MTRQIDPIPGRNRTVGIITLATGTLLAVGAAITLLVLWVTLGDRGIYADATGTVGYTTSGELIAGVFAFLGLVLGGIAITIGIINLRATRPGNGIRSS